MHKQGYSQTMQKNPSYRDAVSEIFKYLFDKVVELREAGVKEIIIDPGFGFGKNLEHNYSLLKHLEQFKKLGVPVLVGVSRKSMIQKVVGSSAEGALYGTISANTIALLNGADILRVHDVLPAKHAIAIVNQIKTAK
jgi:dihydropteroate synthase